MSETPPQETPHRTATARKRKRAPTRTSWKKGSSGNPAGRKPGESWGMILKTLSEKTPEELAAEVGGSATELGRALELLPKSIQIKDIVAIRALVAIATEPSASLLAAIVNTSERAEFEQRVSVLEATAAEQARLIEKYRDQDA
jgi:hypothetical protein